MPTAPLFAESFPEAPDTVRNGDGDERVRKLESEIADLRDTVARFADLMIGEVKDLRKSHAELPPIPPGMNGDIPATALGASGHGSADSPTKSRRPWLLMELLRDMGSTVRMYLDPRYRVRRATQMLVPLLVLLFALNAFFFNHVFSVPILSSILEKLADVILAVVLYQVLSREVVRYRNVIAQLNAWHEYRDKKTALVVNSEQGMSRLETE